MKKLAIIILNWNGTKDTIDCLETLKNIDLYDIYLLDNGSTEDKYQELKEFCFSNYSQKEYRLDNLEERTEEKKGLYLIKSSVNLGFAGGNNAVSKAIVEDYDYQLLLNNDTFVPMGAIESMLDKIERNDVDAITCDIRYYYDKLKLWDAGGIFNWIGNINYYTNKDIEKYKNKKIEFIKAQYITGCVMMIKREYLKKYGLFTDRFFHGEEDYNFCYNLKRRGHKIGVDIGTRIYHKVGQSLNPTRDKNKTIRSNILHFTNRVIDYKEFYSNAHWKIWSSFYITIVFMYFFIK